MTISAMPASEAVFTLDADDGVVFANEAARQLLEDGAVRDAVRGAAATARAEGSSSLRLAATARSDFVPGD